MADIISRLKLESGEFDSKIKRAGQELMAYSEHCRKTGLIMGFANKDASAFAKSLGSMQTTSTTARGKINELSEAFVNLRVMYKNMTDEEKNNQFGKNLSASLDQLKTRIQDAKKDLSDVTAELNGKEGGGLFSGLGDKMSGMLQVFGGNLLAEGVSKLTSELAGSVQESIELARQGEGIRMAFERLNNPGLLDSLKEATHGTVSEIELMQQAIKFENFKLPVEDLANYLAFAQQKAKDTGESIDYLVSSIVTGLGRQSKQILDNLGISASELTSRMNDGATMTQAVSDIIREEMAKAGDYVETAADRAARATADTKNKMEELGRSAMPVAEEFTTAWNEIRNGAMTIVLPVLKILADSIRDIREILNGEWSFDAKVSKMPDIGSNIDDNGNFIRKPSNGNWAGFNAQTGQYNDAVTAIQDIVVTGTKRTGRRGGGSRGGSRGGFDVSKIAFNPDKAALAAVKAPEIEGGSDVWNTMREAIAGCREEMADYSAETANWTKNFDPYRENMEKMTEAAKQQQMAFNMGADAAANLGGALASMEDPAAKAAGTVISAIANIALGFGQAVASAGKMGPWAWLAYVAAGTAALATTISTVHSLTGYANGGVIKGNSYSGDNIGGMVDGGAGGFVGLNAGEVVLNAAQQNSLAQTLSGNMRSIHVVGKISGTDIILSADRTLMTQGKQLAVWGR